MTEAYGPGRRVRVLRSAVQRFDHNPSGWTPQGDKTLEQHIEQLIWELAHEVTLPIVPILAIRRVDHTLLCKKRMCAHTIFDEPGCRAQCPQLLRFHVDTRVTWHDFECWGQ